MIAQTCHVLMYKTHLEKFYYSIKNELIVNQLNLSIHLNVKEQQNTEAFG